MKTLCAILLAGAGLALNAADATANGKYTSPGTYPGQFAQSTNGPRMPFFRQAPVPAFQAAPWYLYWPYNNHFMTPAPLTGAYYGPPGGGAGGMVNPYFPANGGYSPAPTAGAYTAPTAMPSR